MICFSNRRIVIDHAFCNPVAEVFGYRCWLRGLWGKSFFFLQEKEQEQKEVKMIMYLCLEEQKQIKLHS